MSHVEPVGREELFEKLRQYVGKDHVRRYHKLDVQPVDVL